MFGFFNIDKPVRVTSHDVVADVRRALSIKKVGHAGTLDPLATGVLIVCVGGATRLSDYVMHSTKTYRARVTLGTITTTYDAEGDIVAQTPAAHITRDEVLAVLPRFTGDIDQVPPMYSAIKQDGRKLYDLARAGVEVEREARRITIQRLDLIEWSTPNGAPEFVIDIVCSAGTYIRSLAYDIGAALGVGAYMSGLRRLRSGAFTIEQAVPLETLIHAETPLNYLISPEHALADFPRLDLSRDDEQEITHGRTIPVQSDATQPIQTVMGYNSAGRLLAILERNGDRWHPAKVFPEQQST